MPAHWLLRRQETLRRRSGIGAASDASAVRAVSRQEKKRQCVGAFTEC
jgi:hypothetical protein